MTEPTGLDYQAAFEAMYPGLSDPGRPDQFVRLQDVQDSVLRVVDRAARLRRAERERVKAAFTELLQRAERGDLEYLSPADQATLIRRAIEEIR
jgi:hypothetical protein